MSRVFDKMISLCKIILSLGVLDIDNQRIYAMKLIGKEKDYYNELVSMFDVDELKPKEKELIKHTAKLYLKLEMAEQDLIKSGYTHQFKNGTKQVSPYFTAYNKWMDAIKGNLVTMEMFPKSKPVKVEKQLSEQESRQAQLTSLMKRVK